MADKTKDMIIGASDSMKEQAERQIQQTVAGLRDGMSAAGSTAEAVQSQTQDGLQHGVKMAERMMAFGQGNVEAFTKSGQIWFAGLQDLGRQMAATMQASMDEGMGVARRLSSIRSMREALEIQSGLTKSGLDTALNEATRLTESSIKLVEKAMAPLATRANEAFEQFSRR